MSTWINMQQASFPRGTMRTSDERTARPAETWQGRVAQADRPWGAGVLWASSSFQGGASAILGQDNSVANDCYESWPEDDGNPGRKKLSGITRDATGAILGAVSMQATRADGSSTDGTATSDADGYYEMPISNPSGNYKVDAYKAGSPDVFGSTVNTLTPV